MKTLLIISIVFGFPLGTIDIKQDAPSLNDCLKAREALVKSPLEIFSSKEQIKYEKISFKCVTE